MRKKPPFSGPGAVFFKFMMASGAETGKYGE
jgi:hypothetical protein